MENYGIDFARLSEVVKPLMLECGARALAHYADIGEVISKSDNSPLTNADLEIDALIYETLVREFPNIAIVTEERASSHVDGLGDQPFFLVDPIDGTREFINRRGEFTINIALIEKREPRYGVICVPACGQLFIGDVEKGAVEYNCDFSAKKLSPSKRLSPAIVNNNNLRVVASRSHQDDQTRAFIARNHAGEIITAGSSLKFCQLASGKADCYPRFGPTMEWDIAAGHAILVASGGIVLGVDGAPVQYAKPQFRNHAFIASTPGVQYKV